MPAKTTFADSAFAAGWQAHLDGAPENSEMIPVWIYSVNREHGVRMMSQLMKSFYADGNPQCHPSVANIEPALVYKTLIKHFDTQGGANNVDVQQELAQAHFHYIMGTRSWTLALANGIDKGIQCIIADWSGPGGLTFTLPIIVNHPKLLSVAEVKAITRQGMETHFSRHPGDRPR